MNIYGHILYFVYISIYVYIYLYIFLYKKFFAIYLCRKIGVAVEPVPIEL